LNDTYEVVMEDRDNSPKDLLELAMKGITFLKKDGKK
jgi:hypothetical protein